MSKEISMKQYVLDAVSVIVDQPKKLKAEEKLEDDVIVVTISSAKEDVGKIIGRKGQNVSALRTYLKAIAVKNFQKRFILAVNEEGV